MRRLLAGLTAAVFGAAAMVLGTAPPAGAEGGLSWPIGPTRSSDAGQLPCASLLFVGVRGSGEPVPYGDTVTRIRNNLRETTTEAAGTVREVWLEYPAANPHSLANVAIDQLLLGDVLPQVAYFDSLRAGATNLSEVLADSAARCPDERVVVAGFSQGAEVVTSALAGADPTRFAGAITAGNPENSPLLPGGRSGNTEPGAMGLSASLFYLRAGIAAGQAAGVSPATSGLAAALALRSRELDPALLAAAQRDAATAIPSGFGDRWQSVCLAGDLICDAGPALARIMSTRTSLSEEIDYSRTFHRSYDEGVVRSATDRVAREVISRARPASGTPAASPSGSLGGAGKNSLTGPPWRGLAVLGALTAAFAAGVLAGRANGPKGPRGLTGRDAPAVPGPAPASQRAPSAGAAAGPSAARPSAASRGPVTTGRPPLRPGPARRDG